MDRHELDEVTRSVGPASASVEWQESSDVFSPPTMPKSEFINSVSLLSPEQGTDYSVFVDCEGHNKLKENAQSDTSREHGGILVGSAFRDSDGSCYVVVQDAIPALSTEGSAVHLRFRHESWERVWQCLSEASDRQVVGWYHTHPGLGVFMSSTDRRTQRLYFKQPWQVAVVIDPLADKIGYFLGESSARCTAVVFKRGYEGPSSPITKDKP